eukprot:s463_g18.t1
MAIARLVVLQAFCLLAAIELIDYDSNCPAWAAEGLCMKNCLGSCPHLAPPEYQQEPPVEHPPAEHPPAEHPPAEQAPPEQALPEQAPPEQAPPEQASAEQPPPAMEQPPPAMEQPPPAMEQPPPAMEQPPPAMEQPPPAMEQPPQPTQQPPVQELPVVDEVCENGVCPGGGGELPPVVQQVHPTPEGKKEPEG